MTQHEALELFRALPQRPISTTNSNRRHTTAYVSDKTKNDLHKTGCPRYRDIDKEASPGTTAGADLNFCSPRVVIPGQGRVACDQ